jgi:hypothetical protein
MRNVDSKIKSPQFDRYVILIPQIVRGDFFDSIDPKRFGSRNIRLVIRAWLGARRKS